MNLVESLIFFHFSHDKRLQKKDLLQVKHDATESTRTQDPPRIPAAEDWLLGILCLFVGVLGGGTGLYYGLNDLVAAVKG